jgi:outer membrane protein
MTRTVLFLVFIIICLIPISGADQNMPSGDLPGILDDYVRAGLENNLALKQEQFSLEKSLQALKEARGMYLPRISIEGRFSLADGGRLIEIPVGDLMNPVYQTLNQLLEFHGQVPAFPQSIENESIPFLRPREQETKLRIVQPVFQPQIYYNTRIKADLNRLQQSGIEAFKRKLVSDIKIAYFTSQKAVKIKEMLASIRGLLEENLRVSASLFEQQKVTEEVVFRARADLSRIDRKIAEADKNVVLSASYFNFLLNRPLDSRIKTASQVDPRVDGQMEFQQLVNQALAHRQEFIQLKRAMDAARHQVKLHRSRFLPSLTAVLDYGFQGESYRFSKEDDFWMASLVFSWNLFNGFQDQSRIAQARMDMNRIQSGYEELEQKIRMDVRQAFDNLVVSRKSLESTREQLKSSQAAFRIVSRKYEEGMVPQIEYIQTRDDFIRAGIENIIAIFDIHICQSQLEYVTASTGFEHKEKNS